MPTIEENRFFTPIIEFDVAPEQQQALIDGIADEVERRFKRYAGFVSASFHASEDGRRVINYAQWLSKEAWAASGRTSDDDEATVAILEEITRCGAKPEKGKVNFFRFARVIENATEQDRKEIAGVIEQYRRGFVEMNAEMLKAIRDQDHDNFISIPMELAHPVRGWAALEQYYEHVAESLERVKAMMVSDVSVDVIDDVACAYCTFHFEGDPKGESQPRVVDGRNTFILHRKSGTWKVIHYHESRPLVAS